SRGTRSRAILLSVPPAGTAACDFSLSGARPRRGDNEACRASAIEGPAWVSGAGAERWGGGGPCRGPPPSRSPEPRGACGWRGAGQPLERPAVHEAHAAARADADGAPPLQVAEAAGDHLADGADHGGQLVPGRQ